LTNIPHSTPLTSTECIEEMSKIRHLTAKQLSQTSATDVPLATTQKVRLQSSDIRTWNMMCDEDIASSSSSSGRGSSMSSHQQLNDLQRAQIERRFDNCTEEMMHLREIRRLTNDFLKQAEVQETPIYGQQPTTKKEKQERKTKRVLLPEITISGCQTKD